MVSYMPTLRLCTSIIFVFQLLVEVYYCNQFQGLRWAVSVAQIVEKRALRRLGSKIDLRKLDFKGWGRVIQLRKGTRCGMLWERSEFLVSIKCRKFPTSWVTVSF